MTQPTNLKRYGSCQCRCGCSNFAAVKIKYYTTVPGFRHWLAAILTPWTNVCLDCVPHQADQNRFGEPA